jgi:hypothetical protein
LFDPSSVHFKKRCGGLYVGQLNSGFDHSQPTMPNSTILQKDGYLGPYDCTISVGMEQMMSMSFLQIDFGLFWMTVTKQNERRLDQARTDAVHQNHRKTQRRVLLPK